MFSQQSDYDRGVNTFSPEGRLYQVEYAIKSVKLGASAIGIRAKDGIVLVTERKINSVLLEGSSIEKVYELDSHIACAASGLITDAKFLVDFARVETQNHRFVYDEPITVQALTQGISDLALNFGEGDPSQKTKPRARPFGLALIVAGVDENGPKLYHTDPSGTMVEFFAKGIGSADDGINNILIENYKKDMTLEEAEKLGLNCLKQVMEEKINKNNVELCVIPSSTKQFVKRDAEHVDQILKSLS